MNQGFELIVRALIIRDGKILVCQTIGRDYFFLPGGHVEFGENMRYSLERELEEEIGAKIINAQFIGGVENIFEQDNVKKHEVSFVFHIDLDLDEVVSKESHISFFWFTMEEFIEKKIVPPTLKDAVIAWMANKQTFFIEEKLDVRLKI
jgi:ADP-ribose pyrophosphatase YjhB (NUDIX family)